MWSYVEATCPLGCFTLLWRYIKNGKEENCGEEKSDDEGRDEGQTRGQESRQEEGREESR
jgi:hypothetical protein